MWYILGTKKEEKTMLEIKGVFYMDDNFTYVFTEDTVYTIPRNARSKWGCRKVGQIMASGGVLTPEIFQKWKDKCTKSGTFELEDED